MGEALGAPEFKVANLYGQAGAQAMLTRRRDNKLKADQEPIAAKCIAFPVKIF